MVMPNIHIPIPYHPIQLNLKDTFRAIHRESTYYKKMIDMATLVQINYDSPDATLIIKDAKYTFFDQISIIGGTLGIFIGLSIMGIIDFIIWMFDLLKNIPKS